jgi:hypothetical protein
MVYSANDLGGWNGSDPSGQPCPAGYYFYALEAIDAQGRSMTRGQTVMLLR